MFKNKKLICFILSIYIVTGYSFSQTNNSAEKKFRVSGTVSDAETNEVLSGAYVYVESTKNGVQAGIDGRYTMSLLPGRYTLVASFIGYTLQSQQIDIGSNSEINFVLKPSEKQIGEVKITRQRDFWGSLNVGRSISSIDAKKINLLNTNNASDLLQASVSGVWSSQVSGAPGDHQKIRIRGLSSLFGCSDPLYIIDGVAVPIVNLHSLGIGDLNINDIEKVTVLKDAASTALYGYQGANGVVIIDTKRKNDSWLSFSTKFGIQSFNKRYDLMNTKDFLSSLDSARKNGISSIRRFYPAYSGVTVIPNAIQANSLKQRVEI
jgi:TonB-dependent SusC/RagA subfamily outer membrane receptor